MNYALIGCGRIANSHIKAALSNDLNIVGLCDLDIEKAKTLKEESNKKLDTSANKKIEASCYSDYKEMLQNLKSQERSPSFITVATESDKHYQIVMDILSQGINVVVEKPIALSLVEADKMILKAKEMNCLLAVCQQNRFNEVSLLVKKAIEKGAFGKISHSSVAIRWSRGIDYYEQATWRGKWKSDGGTLMNQDIHGIDLLCWLNGSKIKTISGHLYNRFHPYLEVEDLGIGNIQFENGSVATIEGTSNLYKDDLEERITIIGEKGTVTLGGIVANKVLHYDFEDEEMNKLFSKTESKNYTSVYGDSHTLVYKNIIESILEKKKPFISGEDGRSALEIVLAIYKSHKLQKPITIPLKDFSTKEMIGINLGKQN
ncbi:MAG: Gfo/Idh/MocA family protein [Pleomorphochaeta sp.]